MSRRKMYTMVVMLSVATAFVAAAPASASDGDPATQWANWIDAKNPDSVSVAAGETVEFTLTAQNTHRCLTMEAHLGSAPSGLSLEKTESVQRPGCATLFRNTAVWTVTWTPTSEDVGLHQPEFLVHADTPEDAVEHGPQNLNHDDVTEVSIQVTET